MLLQRHAWRDSAPVVASPAAARRARMRVRAPRTMPQIPAAILVTCQENLDCAENNNGNLVCRTDLGQCVRCNADADCAPSANSNVLDANLASDAYCYQNTCLSLLKCQRNSDCKGVPDYQICDSGHCVQCAIDADCAAIGGVGPNCAGHVCRTPCQSVIQCNALNSQINLDCAPVSSTLSLCTESCTASSPSDCYPGNTCSGGFCVPSN